MLINFLILSWHNFCSVLEISSPNYNISFEKRFTNILSTIINNGTIIFDAPSSIYWILRILLPLFPELRGEAE